MSEVLRRNLIICVCGVEVFIPSGRYQLRFGTFIVPKGLVVETLLAQNGTHVRE